MPTELLLPGGGIVRSTLLPHGVDVLGLVFEEPSTGARLAYYTDCKRVPAAARELAMDVDVAILDGLRPDWHPTHMTVAEACEVAAAIRARQAYLTHMTYQVDYATYSRRLAAEHPRVALAHDGLRLRLGKGN
jgi:phosphoribosyl 1,2-cyclic phosphate phosphodiesterase